MGGSNENLESAKFNAITVFAIWLADEKKNREGRWDPELVHYFQELKSSNPEWPKQLKKIESISRNPLSPAILKYIISEDPPTLASQRSFLKAARGITNGFSPIMNFKEHEFYMSIPQIWGMGNYNPVYYGSMAGLKSMDQFIGDAIAISTQNSYYSSNEITQPIAEYLKCVTTPKNSAQPNPERLTRGRAIFANRCITCHDLPDGSSSKAYSFEEMGTPNVFKNALLGYKPPDLQSRHAMKVFTRLGLEKSMTDQVRARRMNGIWTRRTMGTNGAILGFDHLFCLNGKTRTRVDPNDPQTDGTHLDLCNQYSLEEKNDLIEMLQYF